MFIVKQTNEKILLVEKGYTLIRVLNTKYEKKE